MKNLREWNTYWDELIQSNKLNTKIADMDEIDLEMSGSYRIKDICHNIYSEYNECYKHDLEVTRQDLLKVIEKFPGVHLQTSRVKELDSLLKKVIDKRHASLLDKTNPYSSIDGKNYKDILTDLIGIRLIISYRGKWQDLHQEILKEFPFNTDRELYNERNILPHPVDGSNMIAENPKVYHALGDDVSEYEEMGLTTVLRENGYRSLHYVVSFQKKYIEIQLRTIYDEAWSDCDHNYVYKQDWNHSHAALKDMSEILACLTNAANDLGDVMQSVFQEESIRQKNGTYYVTQEGFDLHLNLIFDKMMKAKELFVEFENRIKRER